MNYVKILFILVIYPVLTWGQTDNASSGFTGYLQVGVRPAAVKSSEVSFRYVDESPSGDNIRENFDIAKSTVQFSSRFGIGYEAENRWFFQLGMDWLWKAGGAIGQLGIGKSWGTKMFFRPMVTLEYGSGGIELGDIENNDLYIQVNNQKFYSETAQVELRGNFLAVRPQLQLGIPLSKNGFELRFDVGYNLSTNIGGGYLTFNGKDDKDTAVSAKEDLSAKNVYITINGERVSNNFMKHTGVFVNAGLALHF